MQNAVGASSIKLVLGAAALLALLVAPIALTAERSGSPRATASVSVTKQLKKLKRQLREVQQQIAAIVGEQGGARPPSGSAGGDLAGTYPNPQIAAGAVGIGELGFEPATQPELDAHKASGDHDGRYWKLAGNTGTTGADFLGTLDNQALNLRVNDARALRLEPASDGVNQSPNVIGGIADNQVTAGVHSATIGGGGRDLSFNPATANLVTDSYGTVGGGAANRAGDGAGSTLDKTFAAVAGGRRNTASGTGSFVGGGQLNAATGNSATIGGGAVNAASGSEATVPGGDSNAALGDFSLAAGQRAKANHDGTFVWADSTNANMASSAADQFIARAAGGFFLQSDSTLDDQGGFLNTSTGAFLSDAGVWTNASDENLKSGFSEVDPGEILARVAELPITAWSYDAEPGVRHIGPVAQDFYRAFGIGPDSRHIASVDADGVALAAIKGLNERVDALSGEGATRGADRAAGASVSPLAAAGIATLALTVAAALGAALALRWSARPGDRMAVS